MITYEFESLYIYFGAGKYLVLYIFVNLIILAPNSHLWDFCSRPNLMGMKITFVVLTVI